MDKEKDNKEELSEQEKKDAQMDKEKDNKEELSEQEKKDAQIKKAKALEDETKRLKEKAERLEDFTYYTLAGIALVCECICLIGQIIEIFN